MGAAARLGRAAAFDVWLRGLFPQRPGIALVAVGGLGRRECSPHGDLDLILLHNGVSGVDELAASLWYPVWDSRFGLDHSTRTISESLDAAHDDVKVALGLLDARHVAGDEHLTGQLARAAHDMWRRTAARQLGRLREMCEERHRVHGELAYLLEGDLKEAAGGLRDVGVLRGIGIAGIAEALPPAVRAAASRLLDVRDALHLSAGRRADRLRAQERDAVASMLGLTRRDSAGQGAGDHLRDGDGDGGVAEGLGVATAERGDGDALLRRIGLDARTISWTLTDAWRSVQRWRARLRTGSAATKRTPVARDVVALDGEIVLARAAIGPRPDPSLSLRVAAAAAQAQMPIARATLEWLVRFGQPLPVPWPGAARNAFLSLLGSGPGLVAAWEACDRFGLTGQWLPQWTRVRGTPQHHPVHEYTLDRHLVQAAANSARWTREVARPDLLVLGSLLHDIGKGLPGDHSEVGAPIAAAIAAEIGLVAADIRTIRSVVLHHLLLPDVATRRDLDDPAVITGVAEKVRDITTLEILHMLARADAAATGPAAWSTWKGRLIDQLVARVTAVLGGIGEPLRTDPSPALVAGALPVVQVADDWVAVAATDRIGLLAGIAGCLAGHRLEIAAVNSVTLHDRAVFEIAVSSRFAPVDRDLLAADLRRVALDQFAVSPRLEARARRASAQPARVIWAASDLLEVRAADAPGLLYRVTSALARLGVDVRLARVSTLGADVVDAFYLTGPFDPDDVSKAVLEAAS